MGRQFEILAVGFVLVLLTVATAAQQAASPGADSKRSIRAEYTRSNQLPVEIAFLETMRFLHAVNANNSDTAVAFVKQGMDLDDTEAEEFLALMLSTFESVTAEIQRKQYDKACSAGLPRVVGAQVYAALEAMDDVPEHVAGVRLHKLRADLGPDRVRRLEQWLESQKLNIVHVKFNRKSLHTSRGESANALLGDLCAGLAAMQPGETQ